MSQVVSRDGTSIAYERTGVGPALILVGGGLDDSSENVPLAAALARRFTAYNYARRGRGESGDAAPYAVERELEDIAALVEEAGGRAHLLGISSGGMLALEAAMGGLPIDRVAVYEVPYDMSEDAPRRFREYRQRLEAALGDGRQGDAVALFMRLAGSSDQEIERARSSPLWEGLEGLAHTLAYDAELYGPPPVTRLASLIQPVLVTTGGRAPFFEACADALAAAIPNAERVTLHGQGHVVDPEAIIPALERFLHRAR